MLVENLTSCTVALKQGKKYEASEGGLRIKLSQSGRLTIGTGGQAARPFIEAEMPGAEAKKFAQGLRAALALEDFVNHALKNRADAGTAQPPTPPKGEPPVKVPLPTQKSKAYLRY